MISVDAFRSLGACLLVSSLCAASTSPAMAEPPPPAPPVARPVAPGAAEALQRYQEGILARQQGDWERSRVLLLKSWGLQRHYQTAANLGEVELKLGHPREAVEHLAYFLEAAPASVPAVDRARGQTMLDQARASLGTLRVVTSRDAEVYVDGQKVEYVPMNGLILVEPGRRRVEARRLGYPLVARDREVRAGSVVEVDLTVPAAKESLPVDKRGGSKGWVIAGTAATALGVAMGTGFAILSEVKRHERDDAKKNGATSICREIGGGCEPYNAPEHARGAFLTASLVSFLAAGAIGAGTLTYSLATRTNDSRGQVKATASLGAGRVAGAVEISW